MNNGPPSKAIFHVSPEIPHLALLTYPKKAFVIDRTDYQVKSIRAQEIQILSGPALQQDFRFRILFSLVRLSHWC